MHCALFIFCMSISLTIGAQIESPHGSSLSFHMTSLSEVIQRLPDGTAVKCESRYATYRDSLGRLRMEGDLGSPANAGCGDHLHTVTIIDPVASDQFIWVLKDGYVNSKHYSRQHIVLPQGDRPETRVKATFAEGQLIGMDQVQGIPCEVRRFSEALHGGSILAGDQQVSLVRETCTSAEFGGLRESTVNPATGEYVTTLVVESLTREEPDASLFRPPADYTERPATAPPEQFVPLPSR
jgi:hypothetical protein